MYVQRCSTALSFCNLWDFFFTLCINDKKKSGRWKMHMKWYVRSCAWFVCLGARDRKDPFNYLSCCFYWVNQGQIGRGSGVVGVGLSSAAKSPSGSDQILLLYQMESSSGNVRRLPAQNCHLLFFKVYSKDEKLYGSGERTDS